MIYDEGQLSIRFGNGVVQQLLNVHGIGVKKFADGFRVEGVNFHKCQLRHRVCHPVNARINDTLERLCVANEKLNFSSELRERTKHGLVKAIDNW